MKKTLIIFIAFATFSCTDLNLKPSDADVDAEIFKEGEAYRSYLAKVYGAYSLTGQEGPAGDGDISIVNDEGFTSYIRSYWKAQELTTDEAIISWTDAGIRDLNTMNWSSENQFVRVLYYRIFYIIAYSNDFMAQSTPELLDERGISQQWQTEIATYRAEVRFLRALAYWHALDLFRNVPLLTKISTDLPSQASPEELFNFIENELIAIEPQMVAPMANEYGRADRAALWMLQAKLYLNAEVYINQAKYADVITAVDKITAAGYGLHTNYFELFMADNHNYSAPYAAAPEIIFALNSDGDKTKNWGNTTFLVHAAIGGSMEATDYGVGGGWAGLRTTPKMIEKFGPDTTDIAGMDPRQIFYTAGQTASVDDIGTFENGWAVPKFVNVDSNGQPGVDLDFPDTDNPMFRLADAYLMYAEAFKKGGGGTEATAVGYINALRNRVGAPTIVAGDLTADFVLDERVREMYWESTRRQDLIRYGKFVGASQEVWPWKGGEVDGTTVDAKYVIFPIPASDLNVNEKLIQNDGY